MNDNSIEECNIPGFQILCLTSEEDYYYNEPNEDEEEINWIDDCECQENLATIFTLNPEECMIDKDNHIHSLDGIHLFFEEIGHLTEEPEPIDPSRDYEAEAQALFEKRNIKARRQHIDLPTPMPSLDDSNSGISSTRSSYHQDDLRIVRQPTTQKTTSTYTYCTFNLL